MCAIFRSLCLMAAITATSVGHQSSNKIQARIVVSDAQIATCDESGPMVVRRPILVSPNGHRAYAEILSNGHAGGACSNTSKLFVKLLHEKEFRIAYVQAPSKSADLNDIKIVDWSRNNRYLLADLVIGQWGSDFGGNIPILYDVQTGTLMRQVDFNAALKAYFDKQCSINPAIELLGFAPSSNVVIGVKPARDMVEGSLEPDSCIKSEQLLLLNSATHTISPYAGNSQIQKYGRTLK